MEEGTPHRTLQEENPVKFFVFQCVMGFIDPYRT